MITPADYFDKLNHKYLAVHRDKEDRFWTTYMGTSSDKEGFTQAEARWSAFISNANRLLEVRDYLKTLETSPDFQRKKEIVTGLKGWLAFFEAHALASKEARKQKEALIKQEADLFENRKNHALIYLDEKGNQKEGSLLVLSANILANKHEGVRKSSHNALLELEQWVLQNGYIELIKNRNRFARILGYNNFFDYSVEKTENMTTETLFKILDDFEKQTRVTNANSINALVKAHGEKAATGYNFKYTWSGDAMRELDPYVPFSKSLSRWVASFGRMNIDYRGAELTLDLLDRKGKYQNGFCHGPVPSFFDNGKWIPAKVNFTSNATPGQVGSGFNGINTLFHEGGHAAHFANITMNAPCFSQEFAPTSMALAETQSMFFDSLLDDGDWLKCYAKDRQGKPVPDTIIKTLIENRQPFMAYSERSILVVPYFERAIYSLPDTQMTARQITDLAREMEKKILGLEVSPRPLLAIPHLLSNDSACSYQGYLLAHMAVYHTRAFFKDQFGYLADNPAIGPLLAKHYWAPGNSITHDETLRQLTGEGFNPTYLAEACNLSAKDAWAAEQLQIKKMKSRKQPDPKPLNASITVVDGNDILASNDISNEDMCNQFESYIDKNGNR